jgi:hypothetical protein
MRRTEKILLLRLAQEFAFKSRAEVQTEKRTRHVLKDGAYVEVEEACAQLDPGFIQGETLDPEELDTQLRKLINV